MDTLVTCSCGVPGYRKDMALHYDRCKKRASKVQAQAKSPHVKAPERHLSTSDPDYGAALRARKGREKQAQPTRHERPADDALYTSTMESVFYAPHYVARGLPLRRLSVEGLHPAALVEFSLWLETGETP